MSRKPARELYDAIVDLEPKRKGEIPEYAYALLKITYQIAHGRVAPTAAEPLLHDIYRDQSLQPRLPQGSDFWVCKPATDVVLQGAACTPDAKPMRSHTVSATIGNTAKRISVLGRREIVGRPGALAVREAEPFTEMPLVYANAYGGVDPRAEVPEPEREGFARLLAAGMAYDHPGAYPRNPIGKGYMIYPEPIQGLEMPNLEDPSDLLRPERLATGDPRSWHRQPLPWCFEWTNMLMYPRELYGGYDAWYPCPTNVLIAEVQRGLIPARLAETVRGADHTLPEFYQEASLGMVFRTPLGGQPVALMGMHPEEPLIRFNIPPDPLVVLEIEGAKSQPALQITNLVMRPREKKLSIVYLAKAPLPRAYIPEIHKEIPVSAQINHDTPIRYQPPTPIRERLSPQENGAKPTR